jgi:hypothetical protein
LGHIPLLPLIRQQLAKDATDRGSERFAWQHMYAAWWQACDDKIVRRESIGDAQVAFLPYDWYWNRGPHWLPNRDRAVATAVAEANGVVYEEAKRAGVPALLFFSGDRSHEATPFSHAITLREGMYASHAGPQDFCVPAFSEDIAEETPDDAVGERVGPVTLRRREDIPTIGFCGLAPSPRLLDRAVDLAYQAYMLAGRSRLDVSPHEGERVRYHALLALSSSRAVCANFILRKTSFFDTSESDRIAARRAYITNMVNSDYILCARGSGNYSVRLYETLSMGRTPVVIDTDCRFPLDFHLDWSDHCLFVDRSDLDAIGEIVRCHHERRSSSDHRERQLAARRFWERYLSPQGFFEHLELHLGTTARSAKTRRERPLVNPHRSLQAAEIRSVAAPSATCGRGNAM